MLIATGLQSNWDSGGGFRPWTTTQVAGLASATLNALSTTEMSDLTAFNPALDHGATQ